MFIKPHCIKNLGASSFILDLSRMTDHFLGRFGSRLDASGARGQIPRSKPCFKAPRGKLPGSFPFCGVTHFASVNRNEAWMAHSR